MRRNGNVNNNGMAETGRSSNQSAEMNQGRNEKKINLKSILYIIVLGVVVLIASVFWSQRVALKFIIENYQMGTYIENLSAEQLARKRTLSAGPLQFTVPARWSIMKDFPNQGEVHFDLDMIGVNGTLNFFSNDGSGAHSFENLDQEQVLAGINSKLSKISTLAHIKAEKDFSKKVIDGREWRVFQATDDTIVGKRHTGIYYAVIDGDLVGLYFFSISDSPAPIMQAAEQLISLFRPIQELS